MKANKHKKSLFDYFLSEEGILGEVDALAVKRVIAYSIAQEMQKQQILKQEMAQKMSTSRAALLRLLDPENTSIILNTLVKAAAILRASTELKIDTVH